MSFLYKLRPVGLLVLRVGIGIIMIAHGKMKVFGGEVQHVQLVQQIGFPAWMAYLSTAAEGIGGAFLVVGLLTPLAALAITIDLAVAIWKVHWPHGLLGQGGYQFPLALAVGAFALIFVGAGPISVDHLLFARRRPREVRAAPRKAA